MQAYLILANGRVFRGVSVGCPGTTIGEVVFATGMVGFEETLTDPSYYGQIITQTYPLIGNYGMNSQDVESGKIWAKGYIVRCLQKRGCRVTVLPGTTTAAQLAELHPDGLMLSNGPGDPAETVEIIANIRKMLSTGSPTFGICLGHQLTALAAGAHTCKLKYGHRGANQPVTHAGKARTFITSQNHGYAVESETLPDDVGQVSYVNANDGTCEGVDYFQWNCFT
uniref:glutamine amidotransferase-related protein n=1 Tax=Gemmiger formicilis TaxID=745368 RepID=UPI00402A5433